MGLKRLYLLAFFFSFLPFLLLSQADSPDQAIQNAKSDTVKLRLLFEASQTCEINDILKYANESVKISENKLKTEPQGSPERKKYLQFLAGAYNDIGFYNQQKGDIFETQKYYQKALSLFEDIKDSMSIASELNNVGYAFENQGNIPKALEYIFRSLEISEKIKDKLGQSFALNNIGLLYSGQNDKQKALEFYFKSLKIREELKDKKAISVSLNNIGGVYKVLNDYEKAYYYFSRSLKLCEETDDKIGMAYGYSNLGICYMNKKEYEKALRYYHKSLRLCEDIGERKQMTIALLNIAAVYENQGDLKNAELYLKRSLEVSQDLGYPDNILRAAGNLKNIYSKQNNPTEALKMYELYIQMRDSVNSEKTRKASLRSQFQYEFTTKENIEREKRDRERLLEEERSQIQKIIIWCIAAGLLLAAVFSVFLLRSLQQNRRANKIITAQKEEVERQKSFVEEKNYIIEEKQKEIIDSIHYAGRIQRALIPSEKFFEKELKRLKK